MKVEVVKLNRKYNLGNYETLDVGFEAVLTEIEGADADKVLEVARGLEKLADSYFQAGRFQKEEPVEEKPKGVIVNLDNIEWETQTATAKGPWEKSVTEPVDYWTLKKAIEEKGKPVFASGFLVWLCSDGALGRRKK